MNNNRNKIVSSIVSLFMITFILIVVSMQFSSCSGFAEHNGADDKSAPKDTLARLTDSLKSLYDYSSNHKPYKLTYLEFGSKGCIPCKKMEIVMDSVKAECGSSVNIVMYNVSDKKNKVLVKYYGIEFIPVQVLLDEKGNECFRHVGYYPYDSLVVEFRKHDAIN